MIQWNKLTALELDLIDRIVDRAMQMSETKGLDLERCDLHMDISAAHLSCPLRLDQLLTFPDGDFLHDVFGIRRHLNRSTGQIMDHFMPRCAIPTATRSITL